MPSIVSLYCNVKNKTSLFMMRTTNSDKTVICKSLLHFDFAKFILKYDFLPSVRTTFINVKIRIVKNTRLLAEIVR